MKNIAVFGLGYVGLPLSLSLSMKGCKVYGIDINDKLVTELNNGETHHLELYNGRSIQEILKEEIRSGRFLIYSDAKEALKNCDTIIVTVGIPVYDGRIDNRHIESVCVSIAKELKKGDLVLIRSTVVPGTTRDFVLPILEKSGLKAGIDFHLAYSSERIAEGKAFEEFENMPSLVAGIDDESTDKAADILAILSKAEIHKVSSFEVVEISKVLENLSRDINIAMVNEFSRLTKAMSVDIFEVIKAANTHKRVNLLNPGPGVGGFCIPNAFYYLEAKARELEIELELSKISREINSKRPRYVADLALKRLENARNSKIAVLGLAMKDFSPDDRISPAIEVVQCLIDSGAEVAAFDPAVKSNYPYKVNSLNEALRDASGAIILAKQHGIEYKNFEYFASVMNKDSKPFIVDTRHVYEINDYHNGYIEIESI